MKTFTEECLIRLAVAKDFKMYKEDGRLMISAEGIIYNGGDYRVEEVIHNAYFFIMSRIEAKRLVQQAKVVLD